MTWVWLTLMAATSQALRNALQSKLAESINALGVTFSRFVFAVPLAALYLLVLSKVYQQDLIQQFSQVQQSHFLLMCFLGAIMQILATYFMVLLFKQKNYLIGAGLAKTEALFAAVLGVAFFGAALSGQGWLGVLIGAIAVLVLGGWSRYSKPSPIALILGLSSGVCFALASLFLREASLGVGLTFPFNAAWALLIVLTLQTVIMFSVIALGQPGTFKRMTSYPLRILATSVTGFLASVGWFSAVALQEAAYVRTLGQFEIVVSVLLSIILLNQKPDKQTIFGLILISLSSVIVIFS